MAIFRAAFGALLRLRRAELYALLAVLSLASTLPQYSWALRASLGRYNEPVAIARNIAAHGAYANPYGVLDTGPTVHMPPLFPLFLAGLIRLFGEPGFVFAATYCCIAAHAVYTLLFVPLSEALFGSPTPGVAAALLAILIPTFPVLPQSEACYIATGSMLFCIASAKLFAAAIPVYARAGVAGVMAGALLLTSATPLFVICAWLLFLLASRKCSIRQAAVFGVVAGGVALAVLSPWILRNWRVMGHPVVLRGNLGLELAVSNNDLAGSSQEVNRLNGTFAAFHPNFNEREALIVRAVGECTYNQMEKQKVFAWIQRRPAKFARLSLERAAEFWFPTRLEAPYSYGIWVLTLISIAGAFAMFRDRVATVFFILTSAVLTSLVFYLVHSSIRYRAPVLWLTLLPCGYLVARTVHQRQLHQRELSRRSAVA